MPDRDYKMMWKFLKWFLKKSGNESKDMFEVMSTKRNYDLMEIIERGVDEGKEFNWEQVEE